VPADTALKVPVPNPIDPIDGHPLVQVPPIGEPVNVMEELSHTWVPPPMPVGNGLTNTTIVRLQPVPGFVYAIVDVPGSTPVTTPVTGFTEALPLLLLHRPPGVALLKVVVEPTHTLVPPVITAGSAFTVTVEIVLHPVESV
jgi:hypothetical protein